MCKICKSRKNMFSVMNHASVLNTSVIFNGVRYKLPKKAVLKSGCIKPVYISIIKSTYGNMTRENAESLAKYNIECEIA